MKRGTSLILMFVVAAGLCAGLFAAAAVLFFPFGVFSAFDPDFSASFRNPVSYVSGSAPHFISSCDVNGDALKDLVVPNCHSLDISVFLGAEDGRLKEGERIQVPRGATCASAGRLNDDMCEDVAVSCFMDDMVVILWGDEDGDFRIETLEDEKGTHPHAVRVDDFNADSFEDIAVANGGTDEIAIYYGNGKGDFTLPRRVPVGQVPFSLISADINEDGIPDMITGNFRSGDITVALSAGDYVYKVSVYPAGKGVNIVDTGDLNGDGYTDLAAAGSLTDSVFILAGGDDGRFGSGVEIPCGSEIVCVKIADIYAHDGLGDLLVLSGAEDTLYLYANEGDFKFRKRAACKTGDKPSHLILEDINSDSRQDITIAAFGDDNIEIFYGR